MTITEFNNIKVGDMLKHKDGYLREVVQMFGTVIVTKHTRLGRYAAWNHIDQVCREFSIVKPIPEWVTDDRTVYIAQIAFDCLHETIYTKHIKRRLYDRGVPVFFTPEEAIAAADAEITENLAKLNGEIVEIPAYVQHNGVLIKLAFDQFADQHVIVTVRKAY